MVPPFHTPGDKRGGVFGECGQLLALAWACLAVGIVYCRAVISLTILGARVVFFLMQGCTAFSFASDTLVLD